MKWIVITLPDFIENESTYINQLFKIWQEKMYR
jgi:hypothetical protein